MTPLKSLTSVEPQSALSEFDTAAQSFVSPDVALRRPLAELVETTLKAAADKSVNTRRAYQTAIGLFLQFLDQERGQYIPSALAGEWRPLAKSYKGTHQGKGGAPTMWAFKGAAAVLRLTDASILDAFRAWREDLGDSVNAATQRVYAVRTFLAVALRDGVLTEAQARALDIAPYRQRQARDEQPVGRRLSVAEVKALRGACDVKTVKGKRDLAILDCMLFLGLRREEVASLDASNFHQDGGRWWLVLTGKGSKTRRLKVHDVLFKTLSAWFKVQGVALGGAGCVFVSVNKGDHLQGQCVNASVIGRLVTEYGFAAGLAPLNGENQLSAHDLRRTCARNAYDNGASLLLVQAMLGHTDPKTTARYIGSSEDDGDTAVDYVRYNGG
jgi:integrase